jgi:hypothetical protein
MTAPNSKPHVFTRVTLQALNTLRSQAGGNFGLELDPDGVGGLITIQTGMGEVVLRFSHNNERAELALTILKKPAKLPTMMILAETSELLRRAAKSAASKP